MLGFLKGTIIVVLLFVSVLILSAISPQAGLIAALVILGTSFVALFKPLPILKFNHRGFSFAVLLLVGLPTALGTAALYSGKKESDLLALKTSNPRAYLAALKDSNQNRWLSEMKDLAPEQYEVESLKVEAENARKAEEAAAAAKIREQGRLLAEAGKVEAYKARVRAEIASIPSVGLSKYTDSVDRINMAVVILGAWALIYEEGKSLALDEEGQKIRKQFRDAVVKTQVSALPKLRDAYGPAMSKQLWEADGSAKTFGNGFRTIEVVNVAFAANRNIKEIQTQMQENFVMLRFTRAQYKWFKQASEYTYYDMKPPKDSDIVKWTRNGAFIVLD